MNSPGFDINQIMISHMILKEVEVAIEWARQEGWNPGIYDAECFYYTDPKGFYAAKFFDKMVGTISSVKYDESLVFAGLYIVRPEMRGKGVGSTLFNFLVDSNKDLNVGIDGVLSMQTTYEKHGFILAHRNFRYAVIAKGHLSDQCTPIRKIDLKEVASFDAECFSTSRSNFLNLWLFQKNAHSFMIRDQRTKEIHGYGVIRKCFQGHKIGPLFANTKDAAISILESLMSIVPGEVVFLDVPELNKSGIELAKIYSMQPTFATVRMYSKRIPALPIDKVYGITSFELG